MAILNDSPQLKDAENDSAGWPTPSAEEGNGRRLDGELRAMSNILGILDDLAPAAQRRVLLWLADRCQSEKLARSILEGDGTP